MKKKTINRKHINIFLTALAGQSSQGQTGTRPRDKRDKMAITLWNSREKGRIVLGTGPNLSQRRGPVCPRDGSCLSRTPSRPKCLCLLFFFLSDMSQEPSTNGSDKLVQVKFFILGGFFSGDFLPLRRACRDKGFGY